MNQEPLKKIEKPLVEPVSSSRRLINFLIDLTVWGSVIMAINIIFDLTEIKNSRVSNYSLLSFTFLIYYFGLELIFHRTIGKFVTGTIVVTQDGEKPKLPHVVLRTLCRLTPLDQLSYLIFRKGFHDFMSNTVVVNDSEKNATILKNWGLSNKKFFLA